MSQMSYGEARVAARDRRLAVQRERGGRTVAPRRWTIYVCPECGALCPDNDWDNVPCRCPDEGDITSVEVVEVLSKGVVE